jgi:hypothetical protein
MTDTKQLPARTAPTDLERQSTSGIVAAIPSEALEESLAHYVRIQGVLDRAMPDCIMRIGDRRFRRKQYWRGVRMAFNLTVECTKEERVSLANGDWLYAVTYRATAPNGSTADGDGACAASEKKKGQGTEHNVRAHAHTRAMNRAISNLVGFGEVSAEEAEREYDESPDEKPKREQVVEATGFASRDDDDLFWSRAASYGAGDREKLREFCRSKGQPVPEEMTYRQRETLLEALARNHAKKVAADAAAAAIDGSAQ